MDATTRIGIYARFSSDKQSDASIEDQVHRAHQWVTQQGGDLDKAQVFSDFAVSGASLDRPAMQALLTAITGGKLDIIVAESVDRISRDMEDGAKFRKLIVHHRVEFFGLDGTTVRAKDKGAALLFGMRSMFAEQFLSDLSDKTLRGLEGRARAGKATGAVAYGYRITDTKDVVVDEAKAAVVRRIFKLHDEGMSFALIADLLNKEGVPAPRAHGLRRLPGGWMHTGVRSLLINEKYVGHWAFGQGEWSKAPGTNRRVARKRDGGALVTHERPDLAIVDREVWDRVQARFAGRKGKAGNPQSYLLSGLLVCGSCGATMTVVGGKVRRYGCSASYKRGKSICENRLTVPADAVEETVIDMTRKRLAARMAEVRTFIVEEIRNSLTSMPNRRRDIEVQIADTERRISNLVDALSTSPSAALSKKLAELEAHQSGLQGEIEMMTQVAPVLPAPAIIEARIRKALQFEDPKSGRERFRPMLLDGKIECAPQKDKSYKLKWSVLPDAVLKADTPLSPRARGAGIQFGCGGWI